MWKVCTMNRQKEKLLEITWINFLKDLENKQSDAKNKIQITSKEHKMKKKIMDIFHLFSRFY